LKFVIHAISQSLVISLLCLLFSFSASAELTKHDLELLDQDIQKIVKQYKLPSLAYAILQKNTSPFIRVSGVTNIKNNTLADQHTQYRIASISKMFVGIAVMQLVEAKQVKLSDRVNDLYPELDFNNPWQDTHPLRLVHLLENTTGWNDISLREFAYENTPALSLDDALAINSNSRTSRWPPGTRQAYTNSAATVAARIVEKLSGLKFTDYVEQHIFVPLNMQHSSYAQPLDQDNAATGYKRHQPVPFKHILMQPSGSLSASIEDMSRFTMMLINQGEPLLSANTLNRMEHSESTNLNRFAAGYGIANFSRYYQGHRYRGHDGALPGWMSELVYSPKHQVGFVLLLNSEQPRAFRAIVELISSTLAKSFPKPLLTNTQVPDGLIAQSGYYQYINPRNEKQFFLERLIATRKLTVTQDSANFSSLLPANWQRTLYYSEQGKWLNPQGEEVMAFANDPIEGEVLHYGNLVFKSVSGFQAWADKVIAITWLLLLIGLILHSCYWPWRRKKLTAPEVQLRQSLSFNAWSALLFLLSLALGLMSAIDRLGHIGFFSLGLMLSSLLLAATALWSIWKLKLLYNQLTAKKAFYIASLFAALQLMVVVYLAAHGVIGIQSWN